jgi:D-serine deaminase-like pyridoxal phosphate-dependent protein
MVAAAATTGVAAAAVALWPKPAMSGGHTPYFAALSAALKRARIAEPTLVIDRARLNANIAAVRSALTDTPLALRLVTKSLQAPGLLRAVMAGCGTDRLMVFNSVMLETLARDFAGADVLLGRPLPAVSVDDFLHRHGGDTAPASHPQWLVDSPARLAQYAAIARARGTPIKINLEIDVGLHRGGLPDPRAVAEVLALAKSEPLVKVTGLMGYDAQVMGVPLREAELTRVKQRYADANAVLVGEFGHDPARTLNTAGSPTYRLHLDDRVANEVAIGSGFVKPTHFDLDTLTTHTPAVFLAAPVLKRMDQALIPTLEGAAAMLNWFDPNSRRAYFTYGYGDAEPVSPPGLRFSTLYGERAMLTSSAGVDLKEDDFIFFRPTESEGVLLQYGDLAVYDGGEIAARWPTFPVAA